MGDASVAVDHRALLTNPSPAPDSTPVTATQERIEEHRGELPHRVVSGTGQKTHGRWVDPDGNAHEVVSGRDEMYEQAMKFFVEDMHARRIPVTAVDVEKNWPSICARTVSVPP